MHFKPLLVVTICFSLLYSCGHKIDYKSTKSGLEYYFFVKGDSGKIGKEGDYYLLELVGQREDDSVFIDSYKLGQKIKMVRPNIKKQSMFNEALSLLKLGDSLIIRMPADSFFIPLGQGVPKYLKNNEKIRFTICVKDILDPQEHLLQMYTYEYDKMESYLNSKKWKFQTDTSTGIKYEILRQGGGVRALEGDSAEITYLLTYLDGKIINKTRDGDRMKFIVGSTDYINGISRIVRLADAGSKVRAIIPFAEGFGEDGSAYVDPYATLVIEMEIQKVKPKKYIPIYEKE